MKLKIVTESDFGGGEGPAKVTSRGEGGRGSKVDFSSDVIYEWPLRLVDKIFMLKIETR